MGDHKDRMYTALSTRDRLDELVSKICEKHQLQESTVRDMLSAGWKYQGEKWVKHKANGSREGMRSDLVVLDEVSQFWEKD